MPLERFIPKSPDPFIRNSQDFEVAKFGHLNTIIEYVNNYVVTDGLQLSGTGPLSTSLRNVTDNLGNASPLKLSTLGVQIVSPLRITTDDPSDMYLDCEDGSTNNRFSITRNTASQQVNLNFASNPAGSTTIVGAVRTYVDGTNLSEVMSFREDGRIGVLNTNPAYTFDVNGTINTRFAFNQDSANANQINGIINQGGANQAVTGINCLRLNAQVSMMVGAAQAPTATLHIKGSGSTSATTALLVQNSNGNKLFEILDSQIANAFMYSFPMTNNGGLTLKSNVGTTETPALFLRPNTGLNGANIYVLDNKIYFRLINTNEVGSDSVYVFATDNRKAKFGVTPDDSTYDSSIYTKAIWDGGVAGHFRSFSAAQYANVLEVANYDNSQNYINVSANGNLRIGNGAVDTARTSIKGSGSTSATTSLLVENSNGNDVLKVTDDMYVTIQNTNNAECFQLLGVNSDASIKFTPSGGNSNIVFKSQASGLIIGTVANSWADVFATGGAQTLRIGTNNVAGGGVNYYASQNGATGHHKWFFNNVQYAQLTVAQYVLDDSGTLTRDDSAILQANSTTKGFLPPRMTTTQKNAITSPTAGLVVYDSTTNKLCCYNGSTWNDLF